MATPTGSTPCRPRARLSVRLIFHAAAPIIHSVAPLTEAQRGELLPNIVRVMLAAFLERHAR